MARVGAFFEVEGSRELQRLLEQVSPTLRPLVARANRDTAFAIMQKAKANAPRDKGDLQRSISAQPRGKENLTWVVGVLDVTIPSRGGRNTAHLNPWVYGVWYEYGFTTRKIDSHPFMRPAVESEQAAHEHRMDQAAKQLERTLGRAA